MKSAENECVTPRGHGGGDGIRQTVSAKKRVPVSSARKFNARTPRNECLKIKLENAIDEICGAKGHGAKKELTPSRHQKCFLKSASVAEITPTTTKTKRRSSLSAHDNSCDIYATPRPLDDGQKILFCPNERTKCQVYKRLMLLAWRRSRSSLAVMNAMLGKQEVHIIQLEMQVDVLNKLRTSEGQKRDETLVESQKLRKAMDILEFENSQLSEETQNLQMSLEMTKNDLKMAQSENNFLSDQTLKMQEIISKKKTEKKSLEEKIRLQEQEISSQKARIDNMEENLKNTEKKLQNAELNHRIKERKYAQLKCEFKKQLDVNKTLSTQLQSIDEEKSNISIKVDTLETQLNEYIQSCELLKDVNEELTQEIEEISVALDEEKKQNWIKSTKQIALLSLSALQKIAHVMLPAYLDSPQRF